MGNIFLKLLVAHLHDIDPVISYLQTTLEIPNGRELVFVLAPEPIELSINHLVVLHLVLCEVLEICCRFVGDLDDALLQACVFVLQGINLFE